jgi:SAM-dependent methyltransferase
MQDAREIKQKSSFPQDGNLLDRLSTQKRFAHYYGRFVDSEKALVSENIIDVIPNGKILNVGCGQSGVERTLFSTTGYRIYGVDVNAEELQILRDKKLYDGLYRGSISSLPFGDNSFDIIYLRLVLHHLIYPDNILSEGLRECFRVLRSGGILALVEPNSWHPVGAMMNLAHRLRLDLYIHGTDDDVALSPLHLQRILGQYSERVSIHTVTYNWRRLPIALQACVDRSHVTLRTVLDKLPYFGHTFMMVAHKC